MTNDTEEFELKPIAQDGSAGFSSFCNGDEAQTRRSELNACDAGREGELIFRT